MSPRRRDFLISFQLGASLNSILLSTTGRSAILQQNRMKLRQFQLDFVSSSVGLETNIVCWLGPNGSMETAYSDVALWISQQRCTSTSKSTCGKHVLLKSPISAQAQLCFARLSSRTSWNLGRTLCRHSRKRFRIRVRECTMMDQGSSSCHSQKTPCFS
jgi:hypothetical protein